MARQIVVEIIGDTKGFSGSVKAAITETEGLGSKLKNFGKGAAMGVGMAGFNLLTDAIGMAVDLELGVLVGFMAAWQQSITAKPPLRGHHH